MLAFALGPWRRYRRAYTIVPLVAIAAFANPPEASAQWFDTSWITPYVDRTSFGRWSEALRLDDDQLLLLEQAYGIYDRRVRSATEDANRKMSEEGGMQVLEAAQKGLPTGAVEFPAFARKYKETHTFLCNEWDRSYASLTSTAHSLLTQQQLDLYSESADRLLLREIALRAHRDRKAKTAFYLGDNLDLIALSENAMLPGKELAAIASDPFVTSWRDAYASRLDPILRDRVGAGRSFQFDEIMAIDSGELEKATMIRQAQVSRLRTFVALNDECAQSMAQTAREVEGEDAAEAWLDRYYRALCPDLFRQEFPEAIWNNIKGWKEIDPGLMGELEAVYVDYTSSRRAIRPNLVDQRMRDRSLFSVQEIAKRLRHGPCIPTLKPECDDSRRAIADRCISAWKSRLALTGLLERFEEACSRHRRDASAGEMVLYAPDEDK